VALDGPERGRDGVTTTRGGHTYKFGWLVAFGGLTNAVNPRLINDLGNMLDTSGTVLGVMVAGWSLAVGVAAAAVRPWSWYVLLASQLFGLTWGGLYMTLVARDWEARVMVAVFSLTISVISFAYFYRRRALFRARWRWQWLERSWPRFIAPETLSPDARPGFSGLSPLQRRLFVAAVAIGLVIEQLSAR